MKLICVGRNYTKHIEELKNDRPDAPVIFMKPDSSLGQPGQPFFIPDFSSDIHHEVEVLVRINRIGKHIQTKFAHKYYDQIGLGLDFTARDVQLDLKNKGLPWEKAKAFDGAAHVGKWFDKTKWPDGKNFNFHLNKNGETVQQDSTANMIWAIDELISYISTYFTLKIGDVIFTGTPSGVGRVTRGDVLTGILEGEQAFEVNVR
ncbi:MAG: fumarylacetoacetate hydrolase family protein [Flavobacteriaceae bacterium]|jgi:2-keto-4-pentenoate hydratase/2-oxohepta-3-ene-1,7-dioic acid hydratase in catechol pathway|nr:fumarylacetoacetate hydrolase family protein [Flavobacteriaceae bacterium]